MTTSNEDIISDQTTYFATQASIKKRCLYLRALSSKISAGITDSEAKTLATTLSYVFTCYDDRKSIAVLQEVLVAWCKSSPKQAGSVILKSLSFSLPHLKLPSVTPTLSMSGRGVFSSSCTLFSQLSDMFLKSPGAFTLLLGVQAVSYSTAAGSWRDSYSSAGGRGRDSYSTATSRRRDKVTQQLRRVWLESVGSEVEVMVRYLQSVSSLEPDVCHLPFLSFLISTLHSEGQEDVARDHLTKYLDKYIDTLYLARGKIHSHLLSSASSCLSLLSHEHFNNKMLPGMRRAALRTPEFAVAAFRETYTAITLDLSRYVGVMLEVLGPLLGSTNNVLSEGAVECMDVIYSEVSDSEATVSLVEGVFKVLSGQHGKIASYQHRVMILALLGRMANMSTASDSVITRVLEQYGAYLRSESNETAVIECVTSLGVWGGKLRKVVEKGTIELLKTGVSKGATAHIRLSYMLAAEHVFKLETLPLLETLEDALLSALDKTSPHNLLSVAEGISAAALLLKLTTRELGDSDVITTKIRGKLLTAPVLSILSSKVLPSLHDAEVVLVVRCIQVVLARLDVLERGVRVTLLHLLCDVVLSRPYQVRRGGYLVLEEVIPAHSDIVVQYLLHNVDKHSNTDEAPFRTLKYVQFIKKIFSLISTLPTKDKESHFISVLLMIHSPSLTPDNNTLFDYISTKCEIDLYTFGEQHQEELLAIIQQQESEECYNLVRTLTRSCRTLIAPLFGMCLEMFNKKSLEVVSAEDIEIAGTPSGTLWKTSLLEEFERSVVVDRNVKRESKMYKLEDQKWAAEQALKKQKGMQLTKKQQDELAARLEVEERGRSHVVQLRREFLHKYNIIMACLDVDILHIMHSISKIASTTMNILTYPLTASQATNLLTKLTLKVFPGGFQDLGFLLGRVTVRLHGPPCDIDTDWLGEPLESAFGRCITQLRGMLKTGHTLSSASFALAFPFLRYIIQKTDMTLEEYEENAAVALEVTLVHIRKRASVDNVFDGPTFMPMCDLLAMACETFQRKPVGVIGQGLLEVMQEVCQACSGEPGCALAGEEEVGVLVHYVVSTNAVLRENVLVGLQTLQTALSLLVYESSDTASLANRLSTAVWMLRWDVEPAVQEAALWLWEEKECGFQLHTGICEGLLLYITSTQTHLQVAASTALAEILQELEDSIDDVLAKLMDLYTKTSDIPKPVLDEMGRIVVAAPLDKWQERVGIAEALLQLVPYLVNEQLLNLISLIVPRGLSDISPVVQSRMRDVGVAVINVHGKLVLDVLLPVFENYLDNTPDSKSTDQVKQNVVILMATLAKHLKQDDPKVKPIVCKLMDSLSTPSEQVQHAIAECLAPLVPSIKDVAPQLIQRILYQLLESEKYGERRGAAYGLGGLVKGLGLLSLKQLEIMPTLIEAIKNKKNPVHREGALMAFEQLCTMMGTLFEPYVINVLPHLLVCFGDGSQYVREATEKASRAIMAKLSGHGVKLVLPSLLKALTDEAWRTKAGSVELLGAMAYCNPKQLSSCLPNIVPRLIEVMADSHTKVQRASQAALRQIGSVIRNPEIQALVTLLLNALADPSKHTERCLEALMRTSFVHKIDAPSLALIVPVVTRSFEQRTDTKKAASQIIGNMLVLTDEKDLKPYLDSIIPGIKLALLDPVPDVRLYSARALGCLVKGIGEIPGLMEWLLSTLISEQSSVDRSGAAQGISEVMVGLGAERLRSTMTEILVCLEDPTLPPHIREGYLMLFIYFPVTMQLEFEEYIEYILTPILAGLASESEYVRHTSYKAGQRMVQQYADTAINLFLPRLEEGLFHDNHRIRLASCQLLGDLLYRIMGVSGKQSTVTGDEDDNFGTDETKKLIINVLGEERRNRVFSGLYMARSDVALAVRQAGLHIWKIVVTNTPKTLKEILPVLIELILGCLASDSYDKRMVASRTLGDLVKKLSDRILPEVVPILERALKTEDVVQRQGVCLGLSEIISATSRDMVEVYSDSLLPAIRTALTDPSPDVRNAAASTFAALHNVLGHKALDEILSPLLGMMETLEGEEAEYLMGALQEIMAAKSKVVLPYMVPKLVEKPINVGALASLSSVAGVALYDHLHDIIPAIISGICELEEEEEVRELEQAELIISSITEYDGHLNTLDILEEMMRHEDDRIRLYSAKICEMFTRNEHLEIEEHIVPLWKCLLSRFSDPSPDVVKTSWRAFNNATKRLVSGDQVRLVPDLKMCVYMCIDNKNRRDPLYTLPGFCLPKGLVSIVTLYREGILNGGPELKEQAILGLKEAIHYTDAAALKPSVVQITGPLIRVLGERYTPNIKVACLDTLSLLIEKVKVALKPFLSQLQTTFIKSLNDSTREVRDKAVLALTRLVTLHNRVDNLYTDIHHGTKHENIAVRETMFSALHGTMLLGGDKMSHNLAVTISVSLVNHIGDIEDNIRVVNGACIGALATFYQEEELVKMVRDNILPQGATKEIRHGKVLAISGLLRYAASRLSKLELVEDLTAALTRGLESDNVSVCTTACYGASRMIIHLHSTYQNPGVLQQLVVCLARCCNHGNSNDVRSFANNMVHMINISGVEPLDDDVIKTLLIPLLDSTTKKIPSVRASSEVGIATLLRLKSGREIADRMTAKLDPKSLDIFNRFLPTAQRVANDNKTYTGHENNIFSFLPAV